MYWIGWVVAWRMIAFRCHNFCWWVMWWWSRVPCCPISKYLWIRYRRLQHIFYFVDISWIIDWSDVYRIGWNKLIRVGVIWINMNRVVTFVIPNYRIFAPNFFNFKMIFMLRIFENTVASKVFTLNFLCTMPRSAPVGNIRRPDNGVKDVSVSCTVSLWGYGYNGSLWFHSSVVINILPRSSTSNISTTIQTL